MNYDEMGEGRELDALVAEQVMGWIWWAHEGRKILAEPTVTNFGGGEKDGWSKVISTEEPYSELGAFMPHYSTDIGAAWLVVEKLVADGKVFIVKGDGLRSGDFNPKWTVLCDNQPRTDAETAPLAICRAALKAVAKD